jgi:hypothetical protein
MAEINADTTFERFALKMISKLVPAEEFITKQRSSMRIFLRMDASVFLANGKPHFMVNELTRTHHTGMFHRWDSHNRNELLVQELAKVLHFATIQDRNSRAGVLSDS